MSLAGRMMERLSGGLLLVDPADFLEPAGEPGIVGPDSVSWKVFGNSVSLAVGGIAAVLLELGEARVRAGVWDHSSFPRDPRERIARTGGGALITVFAARSRFLAYAERVNAIHARIAGLADDGRRYRASDPELLLWVQATAAYAFVAAYQDLVARLTAADEDRFYAEAGFGARAYGVADPPLSRSDMAAVLHRMEPRLTPSPVLGEFLTIMRGPVLPPLLRPLQPVLLRAAVALVPECVRRRIGIADRPVWTGADRLLLRAAAQAAERVERPHDPRRLALIRLAGEGGASRRLQA